MKNQDKIQEILNSLDGLQPAKANPFMFTRILAQLNNLDDCAPVSSSMVLKYASIVLAILALNFWVVAKYIGTDKGDKQSSVATEIVGDYNLNSNN